MVWSASIHGDQMRYAIIENGVVINVVVAEPDVAQPDWVECEQGGPGWTYAEGVFTPPVYVKPAQITPTKEKLLAQLLEIQAQIEALK